MCILDVSVCEGILTYRISQCKVVALSSKDSIQPCFTEFALRICHQQRQHTHQQEDTHFCDQNAPQKRPDDVLKLQLHHVLEEQGRKSKTRQKAAQTIYLSHADDVTATRRISAQNNAKALQQSREKFVDRHGRCSKRAVGDVEAMNGDILVLHDDEVDSDN